MLDDKIILITGGTGSIGVDLINYILANYSPKRIRIFSRDETKQFFLKRKLGNYSDILRFFIGNIRDKERLFRAIENVDIVFHLAALKQVEACEYNPFEAIKTNVIGIQNLIEGCIDRNVEKVIFTSSDKAATPSNTMGVTKLLGEKLITSANYYKGNAQTKFYSVRFGNVLGSRGSLIPTIEEQIKNNRPVLITHKEMTRYIMDIHSAIKMMLDTMMIAQGGEVFILKMDAIRIIDVINVLIENFAQKYKKNVETIQIREVGIFAGEKLYEELFTIEESDRTYEIGDLYVIIPKIIKDLYILDINGYPTLKKFDNSKPFNSKEGPFLSKEEIREFLIKNKLI